MNSTWPSWVEIRLDNIVHNVKEIKKFIGSGVRLLAVVKANGYGHGGVAASWAALRGGADVLGVGSPQEGVELREAGVKDEIIVLGACFSDQVDLVASYALIQGVHEKNILFALDKAAKKSAKPIRVHLKVDTGMGRLGFRPEEMIEIWKLILELKGIKVEGIFSHFATAAPLDREYSDFQLHRFQELKRQFQKMGIDIPFWHISNSGGIINLPQARFNMVRSGLLVYGLYPSGKKGPSLDIMPALTWKSRIVSLKRLHKGESVSYGRSWTAQKDEVIGVVPLGYHDGYDRKLSNRGEVLVRNRRSKIIGDVCMDNMMVLLTNIPDVKVGDEVVLIGQMGEESISPHDVAGWSQTISYEVLCRIGRRVPRIYSWEGQKIARLSFLDSPFQINILSEKGPMPLSRRRK